MLIDRTKCAHVTTNGKFIHVYHMTSKSEAEAEGRFSRFVQDIGIPDVVDIDGTQEQVGKNKFQQQQTECYTSRQNKAEAVIRSRKGGAARCI